MTKSCNVVDIFLKTLDSICLLIAWICLVENSDYSQYSSTIYSVVVFMTVWIFDVFYLIIFISKLNRKFACYTDSKGYICFNIVYSILIFLLVISAAIVMATVCGGNELWSTACAFGFFSSFLWLGGLVVHYLGLRRFNQKFEGTYAVG